MTKTEIFATAKEFLNSLNDESDLDVAWITQLAYFATLLDTAQRNGFTGATRDIMIRKAVMESLNEFLQDNPTPGTETFQ